MMRNLNVFLLFLALFAVYISTDSTAPSSKHDPTTTKGQKISNTETDDCYTDSVTYAGGLSVTVGGRMCQAWSLNTPHSHSYHNDFMFPDGKVETAANFCRDPSRDGFLWCYTVDPGKRWDKCLVQSCKVTNDCKTDSVTYTGGLSVTVGGRMCQAWSLNTPHSHSYHIDNMFPDGKVETATNFCRDPSRDGFLWCYTIDPGKRWDKCLVRSCKVTDSTAPSSKHDPTTTKGQKISNTETDDCYTDSVTYAGGLSVTVGGRMCQAWSLNTPHSHSYHNDFMFPDGKVETAANFCRDPSRDGFLWCYTVDPGKRWDKCLVQSCKVTNDCKTDSVTYTGGLSVTVGGRMCQAWSLNTPHSHSYHNDNMFPDGKVETAANFCRDPSRDGFLWCYTIDPGKRWDKCLVRSCKVTDSTAPSSKHDPTTTKGQKISNTETDDCYTDSVTYAGGLSVTVGGRMCQAWSLNTPHSHSYHNDFMFPDGKVETAANFCRDPSRDGFLWCYTVDPGKRWDKCLVQSCKVTNDCKTDSVIYTGGLSVTVGGRMCQAWSLNTPHSHSYHNDNMFPDGKVETAANFCRDPSRDGFLWCYTIDPGKRWDKCLVRSCKVTDSTISNSNHDQKPTPGQETTSMVTGSYAALTCPKGFERYGKRCYIVLDVQASWPEAKTYCEVVGGALAAIDSSSEQTIISGIMVKMQGKISDDVYWLDGSDMLLEKEWRWMGVYGNSVPFSFTFWASGQPDNTKERCLEIVYGWGSKWNNGHCLNLNSVICEASATDTGGK